jgi:ankyrin repeat protein
MNIHDCCSSGNLEGLKDLLATGVEINSRDEFGMTPLLSAIRNGHLNIMQALLRHGVKPNKCGYFGGTPLHAAAESGNPEMVRLLLEYCDPTLQNHFEETALDRASTDEIKELIAEAIEVYTHPLDLKEPE